MSPVVLVILIVLVTLVPIVIALWRVQAAARAQAQALHQRFPNAVIVQANFFGQESRGPMQFRGTGTIALTDTELYFEKLLPRHEHRIPLSAIEAIETPTSYLGKTNFRPLLKVVFRNSDGQLDSMAWLVPDMERLKRALESVLS